LLFVVVSFGLPELCRAAKVVIVLKSRKFSFKGRVKGGGPGVMGEYYRFFFYIFQLAFSFTLLPYAS
jgi:hypothetical protein